MEKNGKNVKLYGTHGRDKDTIQHDCGESRNYLRSTKQNVGDDLAIRLSRIGNVRPLKFAHKSNSGRNAQWKS